MRCRALVVALVLLVSPPAVAQLPELSADAGSNAADQAANAQVEVGTNDSDAGTNDADAGAMESDVRLLDWRALEHRWRQKREAEEVEESLRMKNAEDARQAAHVRGHRLILDLDTVVGPAIVVSSLASIRIRPSERLSVGAIVPFAAGAQLDPPTCVTPMGCSRYEPFAQLGNLSLFGTWETRPASSTRVPVGLLIALPTTGGSPAARVALTRGGEDWESFAAQSLAIVPSAEVSHDVGRIGLSASTKVPILLSTRGDGAVGLDAVAAGQVMVRMLDRPRTGFSGGLRLTGTLVSTYGPDDHLASFWRAGVYVVLEPRAEARFGALSLRAGFVIPVVYGFWAWRQGGEVKPGPFPSAWGVRLGVGYSFSDGVVDEAEGRPAVDVAAPSDEGTEASRADAMPRRAGGPGDGEPQSNVTHDTLLDRWRHRTGAAQPTSGPRATWTVDLEAVLGQRSLYRSFEVYCCALGAIVSGSSFLTTIQYRPAVSLLSPWHPFSIGAVVPFGIGYVDQGFGYGHLGALSLFGTWEKRVNRTQLSVGLLVALPTWLGPASDASVEEPVEFAEGTRGYEDRELFSRGFALAPRATVLHDFGRVEVSGLAKVPLRLSCSGEYPCEVPAFVVDVVGAGQVMVKAVSHPRAVVSGGARAIGMLSMWGVSVAVEPRLEARFGALALRAGFIIPLFTTFTAGYYRAGAGSWNTGRFPEAWGVRVGVGYRF